MRESCSEGMNGEHEEGTLIGRALWMEVARIPLQVIRQQVVP